ncbi:MAG: hypothetical protein ACI9FG_000546, partial [Crocinitomicaceae bacterium]
MITKINLPRAFTSRYPLKCRSERGFALIATISIMALLVMVALGMLSLSKIELRSSQNSKAMAEAQANARMALMIAIGELQKQMGPDQRISANADILSINDAGEDVTVANPHWAGVWDSWVAGTVPASVNDNYPSTESHHQTIGDQPDDSMRPAYAQKNLHFRQWLVSLLDSDIDSSDPQNTPINLTLEGERMPNFDPAEPAAIQLVGEGSLGSDADPADHISARLLDVQSGVVGSLPTGRYGWWIGDESQKARIMDDSYESDAAPTLVDQIARSQAPGSMGSTTIEGLEAMTADEQLAALPSLRSLDLIAGATGTPADNFHSITPHSYGVLADVREGGLKRDLSTLLERPISLTENGDEFMLYKFDTKDTSMASLTSVPQEFVPLQDLSAYYQLYDAVSPGATANDPFRTSNKRGVQYSSTGMSNGLQLPSVDYGTTSFSPIYPREYTAMYRQPRIIKVQFLLSMFARLIEPALPIDRNNRFPNTHELFFGITPSITLWNPTNLPLIMEMRADPKLVTQMMRFSKTPLTLRINKNDGTFVTAYRGISDLTGVGSFFNLYWSGKFPVHLEPGEVKTMSLPFSGDLSNQKSKMGLTGTHWYQGWAMNSFFMKTDTYFEGHEVKDGWDPDSFILMNQSAAAVGGTDALEPDPGQPDLRNVVNGFLRFKTSDRLQMEVGSRGINNESLIGYMANQSSYQDFTSGLTNWDRYNCVMAMRLGAGTDYNEALFAKGMTGGQANLLSPSRRGASIIARGTIPGANDPPPAVFPTGWPFMQFSYMAGTETSGASNGGVSGGRKFASRPFLHSSPLHSSPFLDDDTGNALYNFGWNWSADLINDVYEAPVQVTADGQGYYGGGYTPESGTTHVIQQEIPVVPPLSIAALSHARLGGWSMSNQQEMRYGSAPGQMSGPSAQTLRTQTLRAVGFGGLYPYTLQAIGNSYAHPQIPANKAYTTVTRTFETSDGGVNVTMADHSYLANKALWDEYCFSSLTPQPSEVQVFGSSGRTVEDVAEDFFLPDTGEVSDPLPNRRITPHMANMNDAKLAALMSTKDDYQDGLADKIAAHLMVEGPFNINSTSVEAWKIFFSSLKAKPVAYLDSAAAMSGDDPSLATGHTGTPVGQTGLAGGAPYSGSPDSPNTANQWTSSRELTETEIEELSVAMVKQV